jgi:hypothetical protein
MLKLTLALVTCALLVTSATAQDRQRRDTSDLITIHDAAVSLENRALDNKFTISALEVSAQLAATTSEVANLTLEVNSLRNDLAGKGSRATFNVLNGAAVSAHEGVQAALNDITEAAADIPAASLEVNMIVSQVSAIHTLFEYTSDRVEVVESQIAEVLSTSASIEEEHQAVISIVGANAADEFDTLLSKASQLEESVNSFNFNEYLNLVNLLYKQGIYNPNRPIYRYNVFSTYAQWAGQWYADNSAELYGGIAPSSWSGGATANQISASKDVQRNFFIYKGWGNWNTNVWAEEWYSYSSTNERFVVVLFRIKNTLDRDVEWTTNHYYSSYGGWQSYASIAVNGELDWYTTSDCGFCNIQRTLTIPAGQTSSVIFVSGSGNPNGSMRTTLMIFHSDSLRLPDGLEYVDDLDYATGGWDA